MPRTIRILIKLFCCSTLLFLLCACQAAVPKISDEMRYDYDENAMVTAESIQKTIGDLANGGGNLGRLSVVNRRIKAKELTDYLTSQHIDWYSLQQNLIVEIPGKSEQIIYFVAHYDKTDANPLTFISLMLNGLLDTFISPTYSSDGALDNGSGVSVVLELAHNRSLKDNYYTYRFLFVGSEETGLRGSRAHVSSLTPEEIAAIKFAVNIDTVGVKDTVNCLTVGVSDPHLSYNATSSAKELKYDLGHDPYPLSSTSDYLPFQEASFTSDFSYGFQLNFVGGILPQRSWFTEPVSVPVVNFSSCGVMETSSDFVTNFLLPVGELHGYQDTTERVDIAQIYELYMIIDNMLNHLEKKAIDKDPLYRTVKSGDIYSIKTITEN